MRTIAVFAACVLAAGSAGARGLFDYSGPDRMAKITAAAKKEGMVTMYTTFAEKDQPTLIRPFEAKYGVKVVIWRAGTDKVLQRTLSEAAARRFEVDVIHFGSPEMEALHREKILQPVASPYFKDLIPGAVPRHREWVATILSVWVQAYNTNLIKKEDLPRGYRDLLDPKWKGKLEMDDPRGSGPGGTILSGVEALYGLDNVDSKLAEQNIFFATQAGPLLDGLARESAAARYRLGSSNRAVARAAAIAVWGLLPNLLGLPSQEWALRPHQNIPCQPTLSAPCPALTPHVDAYTGDWRATSSPVGIPGYAR